MSKHTPGPWTAYVKLDTRDHEVYGGIGTKPHLICDVINYSVAPEHRNDARDKANSYLIAAAPELLEICEEILEKALKEIATSSVWLKYDWAKLERLVNKTRGERP